MLQARVSDLLNCGALKTYKELFHLTMVLPEHLVDSLTDFDNRLSAMESIYSKISNFQKKELTNLMTHLLPELPVRAGKNRERVPRHGWMIQKVFHFLNFLTNVSEPQPDAVFGYFFPADGGAGEQ